MLSLGLASAHWSRHRCIGLELKSISDNIRSQKWQKYQNYPDLIFFEKFGIASWASPWSCCRISGFVNFLMRICRSLQFISQSVVLNWFVVESSVEEQVFSVWRSQNFLPTRAIAVNSYKPLRQSTTQFYIKFINKFGTTSRITAHRCPSVSSNINFSQILRIKVAEHFPLDRCKNVHSLFAAHQPFLMTSVIVRSKIGG